MPWSALYRVLCCVRRRRERRRGQASAVRASMSATSPFMPTRRISRVPPWARLECNRFFYEMRHQPSDNLFKDNFRLTPSQYERLHSLCEPHLHGVNSSHEALAVTLDFLANATKLSIQGTHFQLPATRCQEYRHAGVKAIIAALRDRIKVPNQVPRWFALRYPYFNQAVCAVDGVHIPILVRSRGEGDRFRSKTGHTTTNVLIAGDWSTRVCYVYAGVEGSAHDSKVLALSGFEDAIPKNAVVLADAGYPLTSKLLTPYRSQRYGLKEWDPIATKRPCTAKELFNLKHAQARSTVERIFGLLKKRFRILHEENACELGFIKETIFACCCLHNFICDEKDRARGIQTAFLEDTFIPYDFETPEEQRCYLAEQMWSNYKAKSPRGACMDGSRCSC